MKHLSEYLIEDGLAAATPSSTPGMGNPSAPSLSPIPGDVEGSEPGSGDQFVEKTAKAKREKRKKKIVSSEHE